MSAKFKTDDLVSWNGGGKKPLTGKVVSHYVSTFNGASRYVVTTDVSTWDCGEDALTAVPSTASLPTVTQSDGLTPDAPKSDAVPAKRKIEPRCPCCGVTSEFNYVGLTVECVNFKCDHFNVKAFQKAYSHG